VQKRLGVVHLVARLVQPTQDAGQRRADVVRDRIGHVAYALHQGLDTVQHVVDVVPQLGELILIRRHRDAPRQFAGTNMKSGVSDGFDALPKLAAENEGAYEYKQKADEGGGNDGISDELLDFLQVMRIAAHHQCAAVGQRMYAQQRRHGSAAAQHVQQEGNGRIAYIIEGRKHVQVARHFVAPFVDQQVHLGVDVGLVGKQLLDFRLQRLAPVFLGMDDQTLRGQYDLARELRLENVDNLSVRKDKQENRGADGKHAIVECEPEGHRPPQPAPCGGDVCTAHDWLCAAFAGSCLLDSI
jgi:hypothetical protein